MKEVTYSELKESLKIGDFFLVHHTDWWYLAKATKSLCIKESIKGIQFWNLLLKSNNPERLFDLGTPETWDILRLTYYWTSSWGRSTNINFYFLEENELEAFTSFLLEEKQAKKDKKKAEKELKQLIRKVFELDLSIPELELGERLVEKGNSKADVENRAIDLALNRTIQNLGLDSIQLIEKAIKDLSQNEPWKVRHIVLSPGKKKEITFTLKLYLD